MRLVRRHWNELGHICGGFIYLIFCKYFLCFLFKDLNRFRPVYSAKDFLDVICVLVNPNLKIDESLWKLDVLFFFCLFLIIFDYFI